MLETSSSLDPFAFVLGMSDAEMHARLHKFRERHYTAQGT